jgi:lipoprotein-anchoring transpeptidase ErfK/SrfK
MEVDGVHRRLLTGVAAGAALSMTATACSGTRALGLGPSKQAVQLQISPANGTGATRTDNPILVQATGGKIENVTVTGPKGQVDGELTADGTHWQSRWALDPATTYRVTATGLGEDGRTQTVSSAFTTRKVKHSITPSVVAPNEGEKVGVGMPIILHFDAPIQNRAAVEAALEVRSTDPVVGAWHWYDDQSLIFRTKNYWPADTKVEFIGHFAGVPEAKNTFGTDNLDLHFTIGDSHITVANSHTHHQTIRKNGKVIKTMPVSMGRGGVRKYTTTSGIHLTMDKEYSTVMDSTTTGCGPGCADYYRETVYWTVRISDSGEFEHSAPWSVGDQGVDNVSHGCINLSPKNAIWFFHFSNRGDIVQVKGTSRVLEPDNGWGMWQESWPDWLKYSALHQAVTTSDLEGRPQAAAAVPAPSTSPPTMPAPAKTS